MTHVDVVVHAVHHRAGAQEHVGLEEAVAEQVEDREGVAGRTQAGAEHHVADLAHRGAGQHLLDVVLCAADDRAPEQRHGADGDHGVPGVGGEVEDEVGADDQVDARGHHRRRVDQRRDRGGTLHGVQQPGLQRHLGRLAAGAEEQEQAERGEGLLGGAVGVRADDGEAGRAPRHEGQHDRGRQAHVADPVDHEGLLGRGGRGGLVLPEADQQVRREADALPAEEQGEVVLGHDQQEHRGHEQVEVAEEPDPARVVLHVADRVDVDQRADTGDEQQEQGGERVVEQVHPDVQVTGLDPVPQVLGDLTVVVGATEERDEHRHADREGAEREDGAEQVAERRERLRRDGPADQQDRRTGSRKRDDQPGQGEHAVRRRRVDDGNASLVECKHQ